MELSVWLNSTIFEERSTIASCLCLYLGATHAACAARPACFGPVPLSLPLEVVLRVLRVLQGLHTYHTTPNFSFFAMLAPLYSATHLHWFPMELKRVYSNDNCLSPMPTCAGCFACCHFSLLTLPLELLYACYVLCSMFLPQHS